jgi:hypothetical protein
MARCPGCDTEMPTLELRTHRVGCVRDRLEELRRKNVKVRLLPKDPDPYPDFSINAFNGEKGEVEFRKRSSTQSLYIELRKIADITVSRDEHCEPIAYVRLLGRVHWDAGSTLWLFLPSRIGRPNMTI